MQILVFNLGNERMGLDVSCVREILKPQEEITPLPQATDFIEGVVKLREHVIAVVDLRKRFHWPAGEDSPKRRIIVCKIKRFVVGLLVDSVEKVVGLTEDQVQPRPAIVSLKMPDNTILGLARIGEKVVVLLDLEKILTEEETGTLAGYKL